jgi:hypothetical protein
MIILTTGTSRQELKFIPRDYVANTDIVLTDEQSNTSMLIEGYTFTKDGYYLKADISFNLVEDRFYTFNALNGSKTIYKGRIFCTDQTVSDYSINKNVYTEHQSSNEYIFYNE